MALQWDVENIKEAWYLIPQSELDKEKKEKGGMVKLWAPTRREENGNTLQMKGELQTVIFLTMNVGMNEMTKKNYHKFYNRLHFLENQLEGTYLTYAGEKHPFTKEMIKDLIGLKTNATNLTKAKFIKNATRHIEL